MEKEEIVLLADDVYHFKEALKNLINAFTNEQNIDGEYIKIMAHEHLRVVLRILKTLLEKYPELQSTEMLMKAQRLILHVQSYGVKVCEDKNEFFEFISQFATAFSVRVSEYLMGDSDLHHTSTPNGPMSLLGVKNIWINNSHSDSLGHNKQCDSMTVNGCKTKQDSCKNADTMQTTEMTTFGVDLDEHLLKMGTRVPTIVKKCVEAIEEHGILVKGIYRVSGVKSRVERLCQEFEVSGGERVSLSDTHPNIIANILKLYLRQLPQPLLTFKLYPEFIKFAQSWPCSSGLELNSCAREELKNLVEKLPENYYHTLSVLIRHLKKVSDADNNMSPSNLGIVFGPTLLRSNDDPSCMFSLMDTVHQTRVVQLIIALADEIFPLSVSPPIP